MNAMMTADRRPLIMLQSTMGMSTTRTAFPGSCTATASGKPVLDVMFQEQWLLKKKLTFPIGSHSD